VTSFTLGEHIADFVVPSLHRLVEPEVLFSKVRKVLLHRLEFRFQVLGVGDAIAPGANSRVWPTPEEVDSMQVRRVSEKISRTSARIAMVGRLDQCDAHQLEPFKLALVKTELKLCVGRRLLSRV
jgi:hypothetical protein